MAKTFKAGIQVGEIYHFFDATHPGNVKVGDYTTDRKYKVLSIERYYNGQFLAELSGLPGTHQIIRIQVSK